MPPPVNGVLTFTHLRSVAFGDASLVLLSATMDIRLTDDLSTDFFSTNTCTIHVYPIVITNNLYFSWLPSPFLPFVGANADVALSEAVSLSLEMNPGIWVADAGFLFENT